MPLYAVENLDDALSVTREFLLPFDLGKWLRLALVAFFVAAGSGGSGISANGVQFTGNGMAPPDGRSMEASTEAVTQFVEANLGVILAAVALFVLVGVLLAVVASVMEFVFVASLRSGTVRVRSYFRRYLGLGLWLFGFRLVFGLLAALSIAGLAALLVAPFLLGLGAVSLVGVLVVLPILFVLGVVFWLVFSLTTAFVVPIMLLEERGVLAAWRRFWPTLRREWRQYVVYVVAAFVLTIVTGFAAAVAVLIPALLLAIPFGLVFALVLLVLPAGALQFALAGLVGLLYGLAVLVVVAFVQVPVQSYLRYYALLVLGDTEDEFDLIPEQRAAVRVDGEAGTGV